MCLEDWHRGACLALDLDRFNHSGRGEIKATAEIGQQGRVDQCSSSTISYFRQNKADLGIWEMAGVRNIGKKMHYKKYELL